MAATRQMRAVVPHQVAESPDFVSRDTARQVTFPLSLIRDQVRVEDESHEDELHHLAVFIA